MNQSSVEKNGWSLQTATSGRPVTARASRTAAVVTSEPFLANLTISRAPNRSEEELSGFELDNARTNEVRAALELTLARPPQPPTSHDRAPPLADPEPYSMYLLPSMSHT